MKNSRPSGRAILPGPRRFATDALSSCIRDGAGTTAFGRGAAGEKMLKEEVDAEDVAEVVANWTGIPVTRMMENDVQRTDPYGRAS
jgi:ATP-dependent Clp protease ATP-binding subunit ClpA